MPYITSDRVSTEHAVMDQPEHPKCHQDGMPLLRDVRPLTLRFEGRSRSVDMPGWYCPECGEGIHDADDMKVSDGALAALRKQKRTKA